MANVKAAFVGLGGRGRSLLSTTLKYIKNVDVVALCDLNEERLGLGVQRCIDVRGKAPEHTSTDYREIVNLPDVDCVIVATSWDTHIEIAIAAMEAGKYAGSEVGGAYNIEQCFDLVKTYERTRVPVMLLENCCYGQNEMMILNMIKKGLFGEVIHCAGGYHHDLRDEVAEGHEKYHYRLDNYMHRNGELYPTHELGPIAKYLNINRGNRMLTLTSMASRGGSLNHWIKEHKGEDYENANFPFAEGDIVTTCIKCAHGETIVLTHDTTLPRAYSRGNLVQGTKGYWSEESGGILLDGMDSRSSFEHHAIPVGEFYEEHRHPLWKDYVNHTVGGHDGMDYLCLCAFFEAVENKTETPIDAYDMAAWMSITCLSEQSIAMGSAPVPIPDFTAGKWIKARPYPRGKYCLDEVCEDFFE